MTKFDEISFTYKPRLGPVAAIFFVLALAALTFAIASYGLSVNRGMSLYGIKFGPAVVKIVFLGLSALLTYLIIKTLVVTFRSCGEPRLVVVSSDRISAPTSPSSGKNTSIKLSEIINLKLHSAANTTILEINHKSGKLEIPKTMIESDDSFERLTQLIMERVGLHRVQS